MFGLLACHVLRIGAQFWKLIEIVGSEVAETVRKGAKGFSWQRETTLGQVLNGSRLDGSSPRVHPLGSGPGCWGGFVAEKNVLKPPIPRMRAAPGVAARIQQNCRRATQGRIKTANEAARLPS